VDQPGSVRGRHYSTYAEEVRQLRRDGHTEAAEQLLLELIAATEAESRAEGYGVAPAYYEQLAILYSKQNDHAKELAVLERYEGQKHAPGDGPSKLADRLRRVRKRLGSLPQPRPDPQASVAASGSVVSHLVSMRSSAPSVAGPGVPMAELKCDKCAGTMSDAARFCPHCGDPVTDADRPAGTTPLGTEQVRLVCPKCEQQDLYAVDLSSARASLSCHKCGTAFESRLVIIRAKKSNQSKKDSRRSFSIRVADFGGQEDMIEFVNSGLSDFELRARDTAAFTYLGRDLRIVQNLKIRQYMKVSPPSCFVATCLYGPESREVRHLRRWRDHVLMPSAFGRVFIVAYYGSAPTLVKVIGRSEALRALLRMALAPLLRRLAARGESSLGAHTRPMMTGV
jgi:hypothetical protein